MLCPSCRQDVAPIMRGVTAYCTSCGAQMPFTSAPEAVNVAGQPSKVGGGIAKALGSIVIGIGVMLALLFGGLAKLIFAFSTALYVGGFFLVMALLVGLPLLYAGRHLRKSGEDREREAQERAVMALAAKERGELTAAAVARALAISEEAADALLTEMAKRPDGRVSLEVDDSGRLFYVFRDVVASSGGAKVRVGPQGWRVPEAPGAQPRIVDAELVDEEAAEAEAAAHVAERRIKR
jgi:hypothetical protein